MIRVPWLVVGVAILGAVVGGLAFLRTRLRRMAQSAAFEVRERLGSVVVEDPYANFLGLESEGVAQIRGNGCLAASQREVLFLMWVPRREVRILRSSIVEVDSPAAHLGKTLGRPLLRVRFTTENGESDAAAWAVRDLDSWRGALG